MKKIILTMIAGLFLFTGAELAAQPRGNGNASRQEMKKYMEQNIKPELLKQKKIWMDALSKSEIEELLKLKDQQQTIRNSMKGQQVFPENRDQIRESHFLGFKNQLDKIVNDHPDLKKKYTEEMTKMKEQWAKHFKAMHPVNANRMSQGPQNILDRITDPAFILMWNPQMNYDKRMMNRQQMNRGNRMGMRGQGMRGNCQMNDYKRQGMDMMHKDRTINEPGIHIFPQPAEATAVIKIKGVMNKNVEANIFNAKGKKIKELYKGASSLPMLDYTLNVSDWDNGIFTVKVTFDNRNMTMDFEVMK